MEQRQSNRINIVSPNIVRPFESLIRPARDIGRVISHEFVLAFDQQAHTKELIDQKTATDQANKAMLDDLEKKMSS